MLKHLNIRNYVLIESLTVDFAAGMNVLTGETGAGKSVIMGALGLLTGAKADASAIGDGSSPAVIEGVFETYADQRLMSILAEAEIISPVNLGGSVELTIRRDIHPSGRSGAFVNGSKVNINVLKNIGECLVDIHSQHQNRQLSDQDYQLRLLDRLSGNETLLIQYREALKAYREALGNYTEKKNHLAQVTEDKDFLQYRYDELQKKGPSLGETASLDEKLAEMEADSEFAMALTRSLELLRTPTGNTSDLVGESVTWLEDVPEERATEVNDVISKLSRAQKDIDAAYNSMTEALSGLEFSPGEMEWLRGRRREIEDVMNKFGFQSEAEAIAKSQELERDLDELENSEAILGELEAKAKKAKKTAMQPAKELSERREKAAKKFAKRLIEEAKPLAMDNIACEINLKTGKLNSEGIDTPEFLFSFNKQSDLQPLGSVASGGEMSRIALCIKSILAESVSLPTMVLDEIDTGVSGETAARMGDLMKKAADNVQLIVISHLPQIAARGERHFKVYKSDNETTTKTQIRQLSHKERITELAEMLGGNNPTAEALKTAQQFIDGKR